MLLWSLLAKRSTLNCNENNIGFIIHKRSTIFHGITELLQYTVACVH